MGFVLFLLLAIVIAINIKVVVVLVHSPYYSPKQKLFQLALVWLLPILGAALVWSLAIDTRTERVTTDLQDRGGNDDGHIRLDNSLHEVSGGDAGSD